MYFYIYILHWKDSAQAVKVVGVNWCSEIPFNNILNHCRVRQDMLFSVLCLGPFFYSFIVPGFSVKRDGHLVNIKTEQ